MKKGLYILALSAAFIACSKESLREPGSPTRFEEGQTVTLTIAAGAQSKVTSSLSSDQNKVTFLWQTGDIIKVSVGSYSAQFTLSALLNGGKEAEFTGTMPASGDSFDVQYPYSTPSLTTQAYTTTEYLTHDKMLLKKTGCTLGSQFTLEPQYAALRLNFYGTERVSKIVVSDITNSRTYTLSGIPNVLLGSTYSSATPFSLVVNPGTWNFRVDVYDNNNNPYYSVQPSDAKSFVSGYMKNMPAPPEYGETPSIMPTMINGVWWAPVNCGYHATQYPYGKLYQWGRLYGQGYNDANFQDATYPSGSNIVSVAGALLTTHPDATPDCSAKFYYGSNNYYGGDNPNILWRPSNKGQYDPCPSGWRVPHFLQLDGLLGGTSSSPSATSYVTNNGQNGHWVNGTSSIDVKKAGSATVYEGIFLSAGGFRSGIDSGSTYVHGNSYNRGVYGTYWSSVPGASGTASKLDLGSSYVTVSGQRSSRTNGFSVRCVKE